MSDKILFLICGILIGYVAHSIVCNFRRKGTGEVGA